MENKLINHIEWSLMQTDRLLSRINNDILRLPGMSGKKTRHFYNNICSMEDARYLEIGTWLGSSICSAMCNNNMTCVCADNWSQFSDGPNGSITKAHFLNHFNKFKGQNNALFIEDDCWNLNPETLGKFNIYMYDGDHTEESHFKAINHFLPCLDSQFIYLVDDWNWERVRVGTTDSIKQNNLKQLFKREIYSPGNNPRYDWHNGISIFVLEKNNDSTI